MRHTQFPNQSSFWLFFFLSVCMFDCLFVCKSVSMKETGKHFCLCVCVSFTFYEQKYMLDLANVQWELNSMQDATA